VTRALAGIIETRGAPMAIRSDNGPEMTSRHYLAWCIEKRIDAAHIQPGKPTQNAHVESFHGRLRDECLNVSWFWNLFDARRKIATWRIEYNCERPSITYGYSAAQNNGNLLSQTITRGSQTWVDAYTNYDGANRLKSPSESNAGIWSQNLCYDNLGHRWLLSYPGLPAPNLEAPQGAD